MTQTEALPSDSVANLAKRPRLGFAGVGWIGRNRLEAIARSGWGDVAAICDASAAAAAAAAGIAAGAEIVEDYETLLDRDLDAVVIATPSALHARQAIAALERGLAVFCQKPLGRDAREAGAVVEAARRADRLLGVDLSYRCTAGMQAIRDRIRAGTLGRVYAIEAVFHNAYGPDKPWFYDPTLSGGGCVLDLGVHLVDLALWCLDFPAVTHVTGQLLNRHPAASRGRVEDYGAAQLLLSSGTSVQLACSWHAPAGCDARIELTFFGSEAGASFHNVGGSFYEFVAEEFLADRSRRVLTAPPDEWSGRSAIAWCRRLGESPGFDPAAEHYVTVAEILDRIYGRIA